ncbi:MAG: hypothetical protein DWQ10_16135, partial [Calditrichaeota bacterium]
NEKALEYPEDAKMKDPDNYDILYFHSVATARVNDIEFTTFIETFQEAGQTSTASKGMATLNQVFSAENDTLFNLSVEQLQGLLQTFLVVNANLQTIGDAIESGELTVSEFPYIEDVLLSRGLAAMVANMILLIDTDGEGPEFVLDERFLLQRIDEAYQLVFVGDASSGIDFQMEIANRISRQWPGIEAGIRSLYLYYAWTQCGALPEPGDMPQIPGTITPSMVCADGTDSSLAWQLFEIAFTGTSSLYQMLL